MKYIVTKQPDGTEEIFIFPREVHHDCMAEALCRIRSQSHGEWRRTQRTPVSAGFVEDGKCIGESESLSLQSRSEDNDLLPWSSCPREDRA